MADQTQQDLVDELAERLRPFKLRLGENTAGFIADGRRAIHLSGGERHDLAVDLAALVDELVERRHTAIAGPGHHALITVDPQRNGGRASFFRGMTPLYAAIGLLNAGESVEQVREEFALDAAQGAVAAALVDDFRGVAAGHSYDDTEPPPESDACRTEIVDVDGRQEVVRVRGAEPMDDLDREMFAELVAATRAYAAQDENMGVRQELASAWMAVARRIPEGPEKGRLRAAVTAAQEVLRARRNNGDGDANVDIP